MKKWSRRVRAALVMGLTWAVVWAPAGVLLGTIVDADGAMDEPWILVGAYPGFIGGVVFSIVLGIAARRRTFDALSIAGVAAWGALAGMMVGVLPFLLGTPTAARPLWLLGLVFVGGLTLMSAISAAGSLALARRAAPRALLGADADLPVTLAGGRERELVARRD